MGKMVFNKIAEKPVEEMVTVTLPKKTWEALHCMYDYPIEGFMTRDEDTMARRDWNKELYPMPEVYKKNPSVPHGKLTGGIFDNSLFYPGVKHKYWVYVPAQYKDSEPADLMLFLDGMSYFRSLMDVEALSKIPNPIMSDMIEHTSVDPEDCAKFEQEESVINMIDNLIAEEKIPATIAVFITPGYPGPGEPVYGTAKGVTNRSVEYDTVSDWNARFICEEFLPSVLEGYSITDDPFRHTVSGISSGGIAGFAIMWYKSDVFGNAILSSPSFGNIRNGNMWPSIIRTTKEKKNIRPVFCVGEYDGDIIFGNWVLVDKDVANALNYREYDYRFIIHKMGHSMHFLNYMFPKAIDYLYHGKEIEIDNVEIEKPHEVIVDINKLKK